MCLCLNACVYASVSMMNAVMPFIDKLKLVLSHFARKNCILKNGLMRHEIRCGNTDSFGSVI